MSPRAVDASPCRKFDRPPARAFRFGRLSPVTARAAQKDVRLVEESAAVRDLDDVIPVDALALAPIGRLAVWVLTPPAPRRDDAAQQPLPFRRPVEGQRRLRISMFSPRRRRCTLARDW